MILLALAFACLVAACRRRLGLRDAVMRAAVAIGAIAVVITENLSLGRLLDPIAAAAAWALVTLGALVVAWRRGRPPKPVLPAWRDAWVEGLLLAGMAVLAGLVGFTAFVSAPNSADAMAYHLPRVVYWVQQSSVAFFPTHDLNQIMLQPFAEYLTLQTWLLSGGDSYANLPQFCAYLICLAGVSLLALELGGDRRAQALAAAICATLPNVILQASGAKNDLVLAAGLTAFSYFGVRFAKRRGKADLFYAAVAGALALLTKGTAYLFLPPLGAALVLVATRNRLRVLRHLALAGAAVTLLLNGPFYLRNLMLSGSPLGFDSSFADGTFRWRNEPPSLRGTLSNVIRHAAEQVGGRSESWNESVYEAALAALEAIGADPADPGTTWRWSKFEPPKSANHEADANNRVHLALYVVALAWALWGFRAQRGPLALALGLVAGFLLFCFYLKWQPFQIRMFASLYVLAAPVAGLCLRRAPTLLQLAVCALLFDGARLPATENWTRPLEGVHSILAIDRGEGYFADLTPWENREAYLRSAEWIAESGCTDVGLDLTEYQIEYPLVALVREANPEVRFRHVNVRNPSRRYEGDEPPPCAVVCMECVGNRAKLDLYAGYGAPREVDGFLVFLEH